VFDLQSVAVGRLLAFCSFEWYPICDSCGNTVNCEYQNEEAWCALWCMRSVLSWVHVLH
jgi:hypothetical protein